MTSRLFRVCLASAWFVAVAGSVCGAEKQAVSKAKPKRAANPAMAKIEDRPGLPRVLLIGDSISIGYTLPVRDLLQDKANVHRIPTNGGPTTNGLANLDQWLGDSKWDVIHFNWGLHDLKYVGSDGRNLADPALPTSRQQVPLTDYEQNLRELGRRLKATGARLFWCNTTPVPTGAAGRVPGDEGKYNTAAARVMQDLAIPTNDLCAHAMLRLQEIQLPANVHFSEAGSKYLAERVAAAIQEQLPDR
jgi:lysophospholipase L1-like esterase